VDRLVLAVGLAVLAVLVAVVIQRRSASGPGASAPSFQVPERLDRADFAVDPDAVLVAAFTSATCTTCAEAVAAVAALRGDGVAVVEAELGLSGRLHARYGIDAVPLVVVADRSGTVRWHRFGALTTDEVREAIASL
jgi:hypothetical protein